MAYYNGGDTIANQFDALARQEWNSAWEVIVSDNGSTDGSLAIVENYKGVLPNLRIVDSSDRQSRAHARNIGAIAATGEAFLFLDQDDEVAPGWLAAMSEAISKYDFIACRVDTEKLNVSWVQQARLNRQRDGLMKYLYPPFLSHAAGCTLGVRRSIHEMVNGFDESFFSLDDTDYCWRIQLTGMRLHFVPDAVLHYRYRKTFGEIYRQAREYAEENVLLYKKYRSFGMPALSWKDSAPYWLSLVKRLPKIHSRGELAKWIWDFGWRIGRLKGSIKYQVFAL